MTFKNKITLKINIKTKIKYNSTIDTHKKTIENQYKHIGTQSENPSKTLENLNNHRKHKETNKKQYENHANI